MSGWTDERHAEAERLWREGKSANEISKLIGGVSRNGVIGRMYRAGITSPSGSHATRPRSAPPKPQARVAVSYRPPAPPKPRPPPPKSAAMIAQNPRPWITRAFGECAYPHDGDGADTRSCCNPCGTENYCPGHAKLMTTPATGWASVRDLERRFAQRAA